MTDCPTWWRTIWHHAPSGYGTSRPAGRRTSVVRGLRSLVRVGLQWTSASAGISRTAPTKPHGAGWVTRACATRASSRKLTRAKNYRPADPNLSGPGPLSAILICFCFCPTSLSSTLIEHIGANYVRTTFRIHLWIGKISLIDEKQTFLCKLKKNPFKTTV